MKHTLYLAIPEPGNPHVIREEGYLSKKGYFRRAVWDPGQTEFIPKWRVDEFGGTSVEEAVEKLRAHLQRKARRVTETIEELERELADLTNTIEKIDEHYGN
jgi:hypothetical protein